MENLLASSLNTFIRNSFHESMYDDYDEQILNGFVMARFGTCDTYKSYIKGYELTNIELKKSINYLKDTLTEFEKIQLAKDCFDIIIADSIRELDRQKKLVDYLEKLGLESALINLLQFEYHYFAREYKQMNLASNREAIYEFSTLEKSLIILYYALLILAVDEESMEVNLKMYFEETTLTMYFTLDELRSFGSEMLDEAQEVSDDFISDCIGIIKEECDQTSLMLIASNYLDATRIKLKSTEEQNQLLARIIGGFELSEEYEDLVYSGGIFSIT